MATPTWARARARAGSHPACVHAHVEVGTALSTESAAFYSIAIEWRGSPGRRSHFYQWATVEMAVPTWARARALGIPRKHSAFCRKCRFLKSADPMVRFLGIHRKCSAFCRKCRFLKGAEHIRIHIYTLLVHTSPQTPDDSIRWVACRPLTTT